MHIEMSVSKMVHGRLGILASIVLQNYQNFTEMNSNMIYIVAFGGGLKFLHKIHFTHSAFKTSYGHPVSRVGAHYGRLAILA